MMPNMKVNLRLSVFFALLQLVFSISGTSAQPTSHPGIVHFNNGQYSEAIVELTATTNNPDYAKNAEMWNVLGLAYSMTGDLNKAKRSIETAIKLSPNDSAFHANLAYVLMQQRNFSGAIKSSNRAIQIAPKNASAHYVRSTVQMHQGSLKSALEGAAEVIRLDPTFAEAYLLISNIRFLMAEQKLLRSGNRNSAAELLSNAYEHLSTGMQKCSEPRRCELIKEEIETVDAFMRMLTRSKDDPPTLPLDDPSIVRLNIISKPLPRFTPLARQNGTQGKVELAVQFKKDGKIGKVLLLSGLPHGLTEQSIASVMAMTFEPQTVNGSPVNTIRRIEFEFEIR